MSQSYGKTLESDWDDPVLRKLSDRDYRIYDYLRSNRHRTLCGVYRLAIPTAAHELGKRQEDVELAFFDRLAGLVTYDPRTEEVWVHRLAGDNMDHPPDQALPTPKKADKPDRRLPGIRRSAEAIRSAFLRQAFLAHYAAWDLGIELPGSTEAPTYQLTLVRGPEAPSEGLPSSSEGASKPIAGSSKQVTSSSSSADDSCESSGRPSGLTDREIKRAAGLVMPDVRRHFYVPDEKPPPDYDDGRDFNILVTLLEKGASAIELADGIQGLAMLRDAGELTWCQPGEKLTMRALYHTQVGILSSLEAGTQYLYRRLNQDRARTPGLERLGALLAGWSA